VRVKVLHILRVLHQFYRLHKRRQGSVSPRTAASEIIKLDIMSWWLEFKSGYFQNGQHWLRWLILATCPRQECLLKTNSKNWIAALVKSGTTPPPLSLRAASCRSPFMSLSCQGACTAAEGVMMIEHA